MAVATDDDEAALGEEDGAENMVLRARTFCRKREREGVREEG